MGKLFDDRRESNNAQLCDQEGSAVSVLCLLRPRSGSEGRCWIGRAGRGAKLSSDLILDAINALPPAKQIETQPGSPSAELLSPGRDADAANDAEIPAAAVDKITLGSRSIEIRLLEGSDRPVKVIAIPWSPQAFRRKREVIQPSSELASGARPIRAEANSYPPSPGGGDGSTK